MTRCSGSKSSSREGPGHPPPRSGTFPFAPPTSLSICARNTRKNDKLSHLTAFRRRLRRESPPRSDPGARPYNRPHQSRSKRLFRHEDTLWNHPPSYRLAYPLNFLTRAKQAAGDDCQKPFECQESLFSGDCGLRRARHAGQAGWLPASSRHRRPKLQPIS